MIETLPNYVNQQWVYPTASEKIDVLNPTTDEVISQIPASSFTDVDSTVQAAQKALQEWRETPATYLESS